METNKNEIKVLKAQEALKITIENSASFDECMEEINTRAKMGNNFCLIFKEVNQDAINKLLELGYLIGSFIDPYGVPSVKIVWKS